jgi:hypothetical protein
MLLDAWKIRSLKGEVCAVNGCQSKPSNRCPICLVHYCFEHIRNHFHPISNAELEEQRNKDESLR